MLTVIDGYGELSLRRLKKDEPRRSNLKEIKKAGERSALLTYQLRAFNRQQALKPEVIDLNEVIGETSRMLRMGGRGLAERLSPPLPHSRDIDAEGSGIT